MTYPRPWWTDPRVSDRPQNRREWFAISLVSWIPSIPYFLLVINNLIGRMPVLYVVSLLLYDAGYLCVMYVVYFMHESVPRVLRRSEKQLFESALVVVCSSWVYCMGDMDTRGMILGLILCFQVIPIMNIWWCFENVGSMDCCLIVLVEVAAFCCRGNGLLLTGGRWRRHRSAVDQECLSSIYFSQDQAIHREAFDLSSIRSVYASFPLENKSAISERQGDFQYDPNSEAYSYYTGRDNRCMVMVLLVSSVVTPLMITYF